MKKEFLFWKIGGKIMKDLIEKINIQEVLVILICGIGLVMSVIYSRNDLSMAIGGGLVGYLGGVTTIDKG